MHYRIRHLLLGLSTLVLTSLAMAGPDHDNPGERFWEALTELCGKAFSGEMTGFARPSDDGWLGREVIMHVRECSEEEIRIPLHVGENRSRTWIVSRTDDGFRLKHDHRYDDGSEESVTWYGGQTTDPGRSWRQTFLVDDYSRALFLANGLEASIDNLWSMEVRPGEQFAYELVRPGRVFRAEFDLTRSVEPPPAPWGHE
ncbi:hypothetical protein IC757_07960 [Wenzhouxiangella sp. AB-CW3]|uniref:hypothetical protein n=1 Tax=Wenzhouxiangella sp. AB-CW3 TaxID=2771012 RepID=UPI00168B57E3|nr:hypothetical protein [Wenzhouxiangella sp. AB-CW3]QOC24024.1 hypothetical protein IC757_07960 [Wenzhouxiangella sp. AB-CW3]